ncbi:hypothetical protein CRE_05792 [Caenorhabditis remanei]|uniref:DUF19 domain-containing protein n=1 Tax=Caenorhabditis remanei TaxID=31234 RepID=E3M046_CAERE|nr:hypothetical protein CRE_05792 [Caenorhabditis remanei]
MIQANHKSLIFIILFVAVAVIISVFLVVPLSSSLEKHIKQRSECSSLASAVDSRLENFKKVFDKLDIPSHKQYLYNTCELLTDYYIALQSCNNINKEQLKEKTQTLNECCYSRKYQYASKEKRINLEKRTIEFGEKLKHLDFDENDEVKEFKRSYDALNDCTRTLGNFEAMQDEETKKAFASYIYSLRM